MNQHYLKISNIHLFIWLAIMYALSMGMKMQREEMLEDRIVERYLPFYAVLIFLPILLMASLGIPRSDTYLYLINFHALPSSLSAVWEQAIASKQPGFMLLGVCIKQLFGDSETPYRLALALIHSIPIVAVFRKYSDNYLLSVYLFVSLCMHLSWMMNGIRQFIAVTIIFAATPWIIEKKYLQVILVILFASTFHNTALFMIPIVFLVQGEVWNWKTILSSIFFVGATIFFFRNAGIFNDFADSIGYSLDAARDFGDDGAHPIRVLLSSVPMFLAFLSRDQLRDESSKLIDICVNMSVITTGVYLIAMVTSGIMVGRMPIYTELFNMILLPHVIDVYFEGSNAQLIKVVAVILYFISFYVQRGL